jgi:hypothetical protein
MSAIGSAQTLSALALFTDPGQGFPGVAGQPLLSAQVARNFPALERLPQITRDAALREANAAVAGLLDVSLGGVLVSAWRTHHDLISAAQRTLAVPGSTELVALAEHQITSATHPYITMSVNGHPVATTHLDLSLVFDVKALLAGIRDGQLVALHSGHCDVTATLAIEKTDVITKRDSFLLPGVIPLNPGIRLVDGTAYATGPAYTTGAAYAEMAAMPAAGDGLPGTYQPYRTSR